jgi:hypothetical protein
MIYVGPQQFREFLHGFHVIDQHFVSAPPASNAPIVLGLIGALHATVLGRETKAILPYAQELARFPAYLQQLDMESNGKRVKLDGSPVDGDTGPIVWGEPGTNGQHAFYQLLHQGTHVVPADFIGFARPNHPHQDHHDLLMANLFAQTEALAFGRANRNEPYRNFPGDRPSTMILADRLTPSTLGQLIALYEHVVFARVSSLIRSSCCSSRPIRESMMANCPSLTASACCISPATAWRAWVVATAWRPSVPLASTVTTSTGPSCAAVLAAMSPTRTELPSPPSVTWFVAVLVAPLPSAVEPA